MTGGNFDTGGDTLGSDNDAAATENQNEVQKSDANATFEDDSLTMHAAAIREHAMRLFGGGFLAVAPSPDLLRAHSESQRGGEEMRDRTTAAAPAVAAETAADGLEMARSTPRRAARRGSRGSHRGSQKGSRGRGRSRRRQVTARDAAVRMMQNAW